MAVGGGEAVLTGHLVRRGGIDGPDPRGVVGGAGCQVANVGGEQHASDVMVVSKEAGDWNERCDITVLDHTPDVNITLTSV